MGRVGNRRRVDRAAQAEAAGQWARRTGRVLLIAVLFAAAGGAGWVGWRAATGGPLLRIREIRFTGLSAAAPEELLELSPVRRGDNLLVADVDALRAAALRHPWVAAAEVRRRWPPALEVRVTEREAVALVDLGATYLVDAEGRVFKPRELGEGRDLPLVTGFTASDFQQRRADAEPLLRGALALARDWAAAGLEKPLPLSEIHLDGAEGVTLWAGEEGLEVKLGAGEYAPKLEKVKTVLAALRAEGKRAEAILLDNRAHPSWVTVRAAGSGGARSASGRTSGSGGGRTGPRGP